MSPQRQGHTARQRRFPRVSGDEPEWECDDDTFEAFSPRERG